MSYNKKGYPKTGFTSDLGTTVFADEIVVSKGPNFCVDAGAANALVATITTVVPGTTVHPYVGMSVIVKTSNALRRGANTFNLNSHGADSIISQNAGNTNANIGTIIAAGAMLKLIFDGTYWQAIGY
jgi:hypothetical protein